MAAHPLKFYINGRWVDPIHRSAPFPVINPATEDTLMHISMGGKADVDAAVAAARAAFPKYSQTTVEERMALLNRIIAGYSKRMQEVAQAITDEMGAPSFLANAAQAPSTLAHLGSTLQTLQSYKFEEMLDKTTLIRKEAVGVVGMITPWNWPMNQIACKVAPALAAGCTMVLKPSEVAPVAALIFAEILHEAGVPPGVFNLVNGDGPGVGEVMCKHPDVDMVSFTGSTRAGVLVAKNAADTVKRVAQELGGKSPNIILRDVPNFAASVTHGVGSVFSNSGQSCNAPTRMFIPREKMAEAKAVAKAVANEHKVGDPNAADTRVGPVVSEVQFNKIQGLIRAGVDEGAELVVGGPGRPTGLDKGYFVQPTVFANVNNDMTIARQEIFGPVLCMLPYDTEEEAIQLANDTPYGLAAYVQGEQEHARQVATQIRAGQVLVNGANIDFTTPFGGYGQSGNGREWGKFGLEEYLEVKAVVGHTPKGKKAKL